MQQDTTLIRELIGERCARARVCVCALLCSCLLYCTQYYPAKENDYKQCGRASDLQHILTVFIYRKGGHREFTRDKSVVSEGSRIKALNCMLIYI